MKFVRAAGLYLCILLVAGCAPSEADFVTPADQESLVRLEEKTVSDGPSKQDRAKLFFLWGQELAQAAKDGKTLAKAIAAFERVVDLGVILQDESRYNLEILYQRQKEQDKQDQQQDKQDKQDQQQDQQDKQDQQQDQQDKQDQPQDQQKGDQEQNQEKSQENSNQQNDRAQAQAQDQAQDMSSLVRQKQGESELEQAMQAEQERRQQQEQNNWGGIVPPDKDW